MIIIGLIFLAGCQVQTETKYQCANGKVVDSIDLCSSQTCPELNCSECPKQIETETKEVIKYQCYDGSVEEKLSNCEEPEQIIKYQCQDGTIKDDVKDCDIVEVNQKEETTGEIDYKFSDYNDYQDYIEGELSQLTGHEMHSYGGQEARYGRSVFFLMWDKGEWDFYYYWAVEVDAESGELIKYKDITASDGSRDRFDEVWWTPE